MLLERILFQLHSLLVLLPGMGQPIDLVTVNHLPPALIEASGMAALSQGRLAHLNDSGNPPCIFITDTTGRLLKTQCFTELINRDWEAMASSDEHLYVGDFGNNANKRQDLKVYRLRWATSDSLVPDGTIKFRYQNQKAYPPADRQRHFDMEAMLFLRDTLHLFSKNRSKPFNGFTYHYRLPAEPGEYAIAPEDSFYTGPGPMLQHWITGAALDPSGKKLALLSYGRLWVFREFKGSRFFTGKISERNFQHFSQKEAIAFAREDEIFITDEISPLSGGGMLYRIQLPPLDSGQDGRFALNPERHFSDSLCVTQVPGELRDVKWEAFTTHGQRLAAGRWRSGNGKNGCLLYINTQNWPAGGYVIHLIGREHREAFYRKKPLSGEPPEQPTPTRPKEPHRNE